MLKRERHFAGRERLDGGWERPLAGRERPVAPVTRLVALWERLFGGRERLVGRRTRPVASRERLVAGQERLPASPERLPAPAERLFAGDNWFPTALTLTLPLPAGAATAAMAGEGENVRCFAVCESNGKLRSFSLTSILSRWERRPVCARIQPLAIRPQRRTILPLPAGEGRGEGENVRCFAACESNGKFRPFSLTSILSRWERRPVCARIQPLAIRPQRRTILPLPAGEGRGEGENVRCFAVCESNGKLQAFSLTSILSRWERRPVCARIQPLAICPQRQPFPPLPAGEGRGEGENVRCFAVCESNGKLQAFSLTSILSRWERRPVCARIQPLAIRPQRQTIPPLPTGEGRGEGENVRCFAVCESNGKLRPFSLTSILSRWERRPARAASWRKPAAASPPDVCRLADQREIQSPLPAGEGRVRENAN